MTNDSPFYLSLSAPTTTTPRSRALCFAAWTGTYQLTSFSLQDGPGPSRCAFWCSLDAYDRSLFPKQLGIPVEIARLFMIPSSRAAHEIVRAGGSSAATCMPTSQVLTFHGYLAHGRSGLAYR